MTTTAVLAAVPAPAEAAGEFTGTLTSADSAEAEGNVVNVSFNGGEVTGRITFLEDGIFRYNVDPTGEFGEYAAPNSSSHVATIQQQPDDSDEYSKPGAEVQDNGETIEITNGTTTIVFDKDTALMSVKNGENVVLRNTFKQGSYDFESTVANTVKTPHNENEFDAYYFVDEAPAEILNDYFKVTGNTMATVDLDGSWRYVKVIPRVSVGGFFSAREIIIYKIDGTRGTELGDMPGTSAGIDDNDYQTLNTYKGVYAGHASWGQVIDVNLNGVYDICDYSYTLTKLDGAKQLSTVNVYDSYATSNGFVTKYSAVVTFEDDLTYATGEIDVPRTDGAVMTEM